MRAWRWFLAATMFGASAAAAAADANANIRLYGLQAAVNGTGRPKDVPPATERTPTVYDLLKWYGIPQVGSSIASGEAQYKNLSELNKAKRTALDQAMGKLDSAAGSGSTKAAVGADAQHGLGWECRRAPEVAEQLEGIAGQVVEIANQYSAKIAEVPIGRDDSAQQLKGATDGMKSALDGVLSASLGNAVLQKDLQAINAGLTPHSQAADQISGLADAAAAAARELRVNSIQLQELGADLVPKIGPYKDALGDARKTLSEIKPLFDTPQDLASLSLIEDALASAYAPTSDTTTLGTSIRTAVDTGVGEAEKALAKIDKLRKPIGTEAEDCHKDAAKEFDTRRKNASVKIQAALRRINENLDDRRTKIQNADKKAAEVIEKNQAVVDQLNPKIEKLKQRYDSTPKDDTATREKVLATLKKAQELSKQAGDEVLRIKLARNGYEGELGGTSQGRAAAEAAFQSVLKMLGI